MSLNHNLFTETSGFLRLWSPLANLKRQKASIRVFPYLILGLAELDELDYINSSNCTQIVTLTSWIGEMLICTIQDEFTIHR